MRNMVFYVVTYTAIYRGYLCITDISKEDVQLRKGETIAFRWVDMQEFREVFYSDQFVDKQRERLSELKTTKTALTATFLKHDKKSD